MIVVRLVSPPREVYGYLRRFMFEMETGLLVGTCTRPLLNEIVALLEDHEAIGYLLLPEPKVECGFVVPYFRMHGADLFDCDGVALVRKTVFSTT